jgi:hypothetical protein
MIPMRGTLPLQFSEMGIVLEYQTPRAKKKTTPFTRDFAIAALVQLGVFMLGSAVLDGGAAGAVCLSVAGGFWVGAIIIGIRRSNRLLRSDHLYLWFGSPVLTALCFIILPMAYPGW